MQNNIILIIALFLIQLVYSQNGINTPMQPQQCSSYTAKPEMDKYVGHWKWTSGNDSFEMMDIKENIFLEIRSGIVKLDLKHRIVKFYKENK